MSVVVLCPLHPFKIYKFIDKLYKYLYNYTMKQIRFVGTSLEDIRDFPAEARRVAGFELTYVQQGLDPSDWKPMKSVGPGVKEIRIHVLGEWRVIYVAKFTDAVLRVAWVSEENSEDA